MVTFARIVFCIPVIILKTVFRLLVVTIMTFPIAGWFLIGDSDLGRIITVVVILAIVLIKTIVRWIKAIKSGNFGQLREW